MVIIYEYYFIFILLPLIVHLASVAGTTSLCEALTQTSHQLMLQLHHYLSSIDFVNYHATAESKKNVAE